jgi:hypothetical protein
MKAYHGKIEIKKKYLNRVLAHRKADELIQGYGCWKDGKGWPERFLKAITPGADLSLVWDRFASRLLTDPAGGGILVGPADAYARQRAYIWQSELLIELLKAAR